MTGVHNPRFPAPYLPDTAGNERTVRDQRVDAIGRADIPLTHPVKHRGHHYAADGPCRRFIVLIMIPQVTHGRMAITEVKSVRAGDDAFGWTGFAADNEIVTAQIKFFQRHGHERKIFLIVTPRTGEGADECLADVGRPYFLRNPGRIVDVREDVRVRKQIQQALQHALATPH